MGRVLRLWSSKYNKYNQFTGRPLSPPCPQMSGPSDGDKTCYCPKIVINLSLALQLPGLETNIETVYSRRVVFDILECWLRAHQSELSSLLIGFKYWHWHFIPWPVITQTMSRQISVLSINGSPYIFDSSLLFALFPVDKHKILSDWLGYGQILHPSTSGLSGPCMQWQYLGPGRGWPLRLGSASSSPPNVSALSRSPASSSVNTSPISQVSCEAQVWWQPSLVGQAHWVKQPQNPCSAWWPSL